MARTDRHNRNLAKVQSMVDGTFGGYKIQIGVGDQESKPQRKVGDRWTDSDDTEWEQKNGYYSKISKVKIGLGNNCKICEKLIVKSIDKDTYNRMSKCYHCQMNFELDLQYSRIGNSGNKWVFWVRLQQLHQMNAIDKSMEEYIYELDKSKNLEDNPFDMSVANAIANSNIDTTMKMNKKSTQ